MILIGQLVRTLERQNLLSDSLIGWAASFALHLVGAAAWALVSGETTG